MYNNEGNGPDIGLACPDIESSSPDVIVDGGESHFVGSIKPGNVGWPSRPRPSKMSSYSTNRVAVLWVITYSISSNLSKWIFNCVWPQPNRSRRSRRVKRTSFCINCFVSISSLAMSTSCQRSLLVCGGSSSMLRPSTASANRFARTISCVVTSMYSQTFPSIVVVLISRWYWCSNATALINVRYFLWSRRNRVWLSRNRSSSANGFTTCSVLSSRCALW